VLNVKCNKAYSVQNDESLRSHCPTAQTREESGSIRDVMTAEDGEREGSRDVRWKTVPRGYKQQ